MNWLQRHPGIAMLLLALAFIVSGYEPERGTETVSIDLPPCEDCTKPQLRVWTAGNADPLIHPRPLGNGPAPHID